jgi:YegS/Rv2252/BmrU family lipid kinase
MNGKRFFVVLNPRGGTRRGPAILDQVRPVFAAAGAELDVRLTQHPGHAQEIAKSFDPEGYDGLCVVGGDGTVHEVANGLIQGAHAVGIPLGFIPAGSGNTMHQHLRCTEPVQAARQILAGTTCPLDAAKVTMGEQVVYCVNIVGWGGVADINIVAEKLRILGPTRYALAALWHIVRAKRRPARLILDGEIVDDEFLFVIGCNTRFTGKGMQLAPHARIGDGKIDVVVLRNASRREMVKLFSRVFDGSHLSLGRVEYHQVRSFAVESQDDRPLDLDGEVSGTSPVRVEMMPAALRVFAPDGA